MANEILTENLKSATHALGELIKADPRTAALKAAADKYNTSDELNRLITEYNVQQTALSNEYAKDERDLLRLCTRKRGVRRTLQRSSCRA